MSTDPQEHPAAFARQQHRRGAPAKRAPTTMISCMPSPRVWQGFTRADAAICGSRVITRRACSRDRVAQGSGGRDFSLKVDPHEQACGLDHIRIDRSGQRVENAWFGQQFAGL